MQSKSKGARLDWLAMSLIEPNQNLPLYVMPSEIIAT